AVASGINQYAPNVPLASNVTGELMSTAPTPAYWMQHARCPVQFEAGLRSLHQLGISHFVEIGPAAVLSRLGAQCLPGNDVVWLPSVLGAGDDGSELMRSLSRLHVNGVPLAWDHIAPEGRRISLPGYAFQRRAYWIDELPREKAPVVEVAEDSRRVPDP